jgi:TetR/AcrR family transcriptional repressor of nem operon
VSRKPPLLTLPILKGSHELTITRLKHEADSFTLRYRITPPLPETDARALAFPLIEALDDLGNEYDDRGGAYGTHPDGTHTDGSLTAQPSENAQIRAHFMPHVYDGFHLASGRRRPFLGGRPGMGHSQAEKAASRERVLRIAARKVRAEGVTRPGITELMKAAGLTHGGFYKHFSSRDDLIDQAVTEALAEGTAKMEQAARKNEEEPRTGLIDAYLGKRHRDAPATGCALVTLGAAAGRGDEGFKEAYERQVRSYLDLIAGLGEDSEEARSEAMLTLSALVGATLISRAVADSGLSDELLVNVSDQLKRHSAPAPAA